MKTILAGNKAVLIILNGLKYSEQLLKSLKFFSGKKVCYISFNKTCAYIKQTLKNSKIDVSKMVFVDVISRSIISAPTMLNDCYFVSSPAALTELSMLLDKLLAQKFEYVLFDSLGNMLIYEKKQFVEQFILRFINKAREKEGNTIVGYASSADEQKSFINEIGLFFDKVIDLN